MSEKKKVEFKGKHVHEFEVDGDVIWCECGWETKDPAEVYKYFMTVGLTTPPYDAKVEAKKVEEATAASALVGLGLDPPVVDKAPA